MPPIIRDRRRISVKRIRRRERRRRKWKGRRGRI